MEVKSRFMTTSRDLALERAQLEPEGLVRLQTTIRTRNAGRTAPSSLTMKRKPIKSTMIFIVVEAVISALCLAATTGNLLKKRLSIGGKHSALKTNSGVNLPVGLNKSKRKTRSNLKNKFLTNSMNFSTSKDKQLKKGSVEMIQEALI